VSMTPRCPAPIPEHPDEDELWVDGPRSSICFSPQPPTRRSSSEGKFAASSSSSHKFTPPPSTELWVDGPTEFQTQLGDRASTPADSRTLHGNPPAVVRQPVIAKTDVTSSRSSRRSAGESGGGGGSSKSRLPRTGAGKNNHCHSSPRARHSPQPVLDGRITAWVKSVQQASQPPDAAAANDDYDTHQPCPTTVSESQETGSLRVEDEERVEAAEKAAETGSVAASSHSLYEREVDDSLETASLRGCALLSSDEDAASSQSNRGAAGRRQSDGVPDGYADDDKLYCETEADASTTSKPPRDEVSKTSSAVASSGTNARSKLVEPVVRSPLNSSRQGGCTSPTSERRSSSFPLRCLSSPRGNSGGDGSQSPATSSRLKRPSTSRTSTPTTGVRRRESGTVRGERAGGVKSVSSGCVPAAESSSADKTVTSAKSQKSVTPKPPQLSKAGGGGSRTVDRSHGTGSPKVDGRSCLPVMKKSSNASGGGGGGHCLVSPYHTVTSPRRRRAAGGRSTSSDNSSLLSDAVTARSKSSEVELSSGYESMLRDDSDETITAHCADDWTNDTTNLTPGLFYYQRSL